MGKTIWRLVDEDFFNRLVILTPVYSALIPILPPNEHCNLILGIATFMYVFAILPLPRVTLSNEKLIIRIRIGGREVITIPKDEVISKNIICIKKTPESTMLHINHEQFCHTYPLSRRQYTKLVNALSKHWNWTPPECP